MAKPGQPRIPELLCDAPTQRLLAVSALVLLQAFKLAEALWPPQAPLSDHVPVNYLLAKWLALDAVAVALIAWLRIPRLDWGWKARWLVRVALGALDYLLFGGWTFAASFFVPAAVKSFLARSLSTSEHSVRLSSILGTEKTHLGGQYTVHILAVSTAMLNPLSAVYCRHAPSKSDSKSEPTLIPLIFNNTAPHKVTYTLTSLDDPSSSRQVTVPASSLVRHSHPAHRRLRGGDSASQSNADDELDLASEWALVPASQKSQQALRHRLPSDTPVATPDASDPFGLSSSESLYYLPVSSIGSIRIDSAVDKDGHPIRIRRKRASAPPPTVPAGTDTEGALTQLAFEETRIVRCPAAGFDLASTPSHLREEHRCLVPNAGLPESWPLGLTVRGVEPLRVRWHAREGESDRAPRREETLEGIVGAHADPSGEAVVPVPLNVSLARAGRTTYFLDAVTDAYGNEVSYAAAAPQHLVPGTVPSRSVVVHRPPEASFVGECAKGDAVHLLRGGRARLELRLQGVESDAGGAEVLVRFQPPVEGEEAGAKGWERWVEARGARAEVEVDQAGEYEIVDVRSKWCGGAVLVPNKCTVVVQPVPTLSTSFEPLHDACGAESGVLATLQLTGAPPFVVHYTMTRVGGAGGAGRSQRKRHVVRHSRDELRLEPGPGEWEYRFTHFGDSFYKELDVPPQASFGKRQKIPVVGDARWRNVDKGKTVHSCEGETVQVEVDLLGTAPWDIEYSVVGQPAQVITGITKSPFAFEVDIPKQIAQQGGQFALSLGTGSLHNVRDGNGCKRQLTVNDLSVEVRRTKPTARFHGAEGFRSVTLRDDDVASIPLRLTGEGPWVVTYQSPPKRDGQLPAPTRFQTADANGEIKIRNPRAGTYRLLSVRDKYCPGDVAETEWNVATLPRPTLRIADGVGKVARNGSVIRAGVCANAVDSVPVLFQGKAPFKASYTLQKGSHHGETRSHSLQAIQSRADLTLFTASPGHHSYIFSGVGDALYTSTDSAGLEAPQGGVEGVVRVEQDVWPLPSAGFAHGAKHGFCVNDELASRASDDLVLLLEGAAPFEVELEVREEERRAAKRFVVPVPSHRWPVQLPYGLQTASPHSITLRRIKDANGCETLIDSSAVGPASSAASGLRSRVTIPVAEIATITPVSPQVDHCVGDALDFIVQGAPPFTVKYEFEGKQHAVPLTSGKFQRLAASPGTFKIVSVGHGEDQCRSNQVDIVKQIHPIPSARVHMGDSFVVDIREGEQTEIVFNFKGTPPFAFTYSRRAPQDRSKDRTVLETHTVTGIQEHQYSIFTSQEGTWSVSYIADAFCSYPPTSSPASLVKSP
ncbi:hypothetical protein Rhopal_000337-T1 [Rhodotorula paludigena]|uniref:Nucleoporin Pom152 n=1 Tax=Rhodotorula paludigena TaxID=86838 RepID=A0AAV5GBC7_9BASI|nr:hypothetical protein Rhopal_000337-T1 [Rhodotorula paludigena]